MLQNIARTAAGKYRVDVADRLFDYQHKYDHKAMENMRKQVDDEIKMLKNAPKISKVVRLPPLSNLIIYL